jgi:hypothetical protein
MKPCLAALVKRVAELRDAGLQMCHYAEEFTLWRICPLGHQEKLAYECPQLVDPCHEPTVGKILIFCFLLLMICHSDLINSFLHTTLTQAEIDRFMAHFLIRTHQLCVLLLCPCRIAVKILPEW